MGISGLYQVIKSIQRHTTLKAFAGQTLGIDAFSWLHKGGIACATQLALGKPTSSYVHYMVAQVRMLLDFGIQPYLVFDGDAVPAKEPTNAKRRVERQAAKERGLELWNSGKKKQAEDEFKKTVSITPQMTHEVIKAMRRMNVRVIVAPFEADAQLVYLEKQGIIDGIITEDSDLFVFGAQKLITKMDKYGSCVMYSRADFAINTDMNLAGWTDTMFRRMAILSGCDYLSGIPWVGLKTAHTLIRRHKEINKICRALAMDPSGKYTLPLNYIERFNDAERTFLYHRVFCPTTGKMTTLNPLPPDLRESDMPYLGAYTEPEIATRIACGDINPKTKLPFDSRPLLSEIRTPTSSKSRRTVQNVQAALAATPGLKSKGSLDSFFKPQRTPLQELDPNSLAPLSASQKRLLERNRNASWGPQLVSAGSQSAPPIRFTTGAGSGNRTVNRTHLFLNSASAKSTFKPVKRQRLCSETDEVSPSKEIRQSPFFAQSGGRNSPLSSKRGKDRKSRKNVFDIFSDPSVEDDLLNFEKQLNESEKVKEDAQSSIPEIKEALAKSDVVPQSPPSHPSQALVDSQSSHGTVELEAFTLEPEPAQEPVPSKRIDTRADDFQSLLNYHLQKHNEDVHASINNNTFSQQSPQRQASALASLRSPGHIVKPIIEAEPEVDDILSPSRSLSQLRNMTRTFANQSPSVQIRALQGLSNPPRTTYVHTPTIGGSEDEARPSQDEGYSEAEDFPEPKFSLKSFAYVA